MTDKGHIDKLARIIADRARQQSPPRLTGSTTAGGTDIHTRQTQLPAPIGTAGSKLVVVDDAGDLVPAWTPYLDFPEQAAPATPPAGVVRLYAKSDKKLYAKDSTGTETALW